MKLKSTIKDRAQLRKLMAGLLPHEERAVQLILDDIEATEAEIKRTATLPSTDALTKQLAAENVARIAEIDLLKAKLRTLPPKPELLQQPITHDRCKTVIDYASIISVRQKAEWMERSGDEIMLSTLIRREYVCPACNEPLDVEEESRRVITDDGNPV